MATALDPRCKMSRQMSASLCGIWWKCGRGEIATEKERTRGYATASGSSGAASWLSLSGSGGSAGLAPPPAKGGFAVASWRRPTRTRALLRWPRLRHRYQRTTAIVVMCVYTTVLLSYVHSLRMINVGPDPWTRAILKGDEAKLHFFVFPPAAPPTGAPSPEGGGH